MPRGTGRKGTRDTTLEPIGRDACIAPISPPPTLTEHAWRRRDNGAACKTRTLIDLTPNVPGERRSAATQALPEP